jgi:peroxiredoxin
MRISVLAIVAICLLTAASFAADKPVKGTAFTVSYDPAGKGILTNAKQVYLVYVFDVWGTSAVQKMKGEAGNNSDLFQNVLFPDEGAATTVPMTRKGNVWEAGVLIPFNAHLLSYYFTDSTKSDYNDKKTYVSYVCNAAGTPVRDARFQNVDFLLMAGSGDQAVLDELQQEVSQYPDNFLAHMVYWRFKFFTTTAMDTMAALVKESDEYFGKLQKQFGDTVLNYQVRSLSDINRVMILLMSRQFDEPAVSELRKNVNTKILALIDSIPARKRISRLDQSQMLAKMMLMTPQEREEQARAAKQEGDKMMGEFVGQPAPDFSFVTIDGQKHRLSDYRGKYVLLDFWGTWCGPCVGEIPNLVKMHEKFSSKNIVMLSISSDAMRNKPDPAKFAGFVKMKQMTWMQVLDGAGGEIHKQYNIKFWPNIFLIDPSGKVLQRDKLRGPELEQTLSALPL